MALVDLIKLLFWGAVLVLALSFFGISIQSIVNSPTGEANISYLADLFSRLWQEVIRFFLWATYWIRPGSI